MSTLAVEFRAPRTVAITDVDLPQVATGDVLVRALFSGISGGTETLAYRGEVDPDLALDESLGALSGTFSFPFRYGYSLVGVVEESSSPLDVGQTVFCFHPHQARIVAPWQELIVVDGIDPRIATMFPLVETALQICLDAGAVADQPVAVVGLGPVGIITAALLARSAADVVAGDPRPWRRDAAAGVGIDVCHPDELPERRAALDDGFALVVEVSGDPDAAAGALELLGHEGLLLVGSWYGTKPVRMPLGGAFHRRRLTIRSSQVSTIPASLSSRWNRARRTQVALKLMSELPLKHLATHDFPFHDAARAFAAVDRPVEGLIHAALAYGND